MEKGQLDGGIPMQAIGLQSVKTPFDLDKSVNTDSVDGDDKPKPGGETASDAAPETPDTKPEVADGGSGGTDSGKNEFEGYSRIAILAKRMQEVTKELPEDVEIPKDLDMEGLQKLIYETAEKGIQNFDTIKTKRQQELEMQLAKEGLDSGQVFEAVKYVMQGGSLQQVSRYNQLKTLSEFDATNAEEKEQIVAASLRIAGNDEELITAHLDRLTDEDLDDAYAAAKKKISAYADAQWAQDKKAAEDYQKQINQQLAQFRNNVRQAYLVEDFGVKLSESEVEEYADYAGKKSAVITSEDGARVEVTPLQAKLAEILQDPKQSAYLTLMVKNGVDKYVNKVEVQATDKYLKGIADMEDDPAAEAAGASGAGEKKKSIQDLLAGAKFLGKS